jgi:GTPase SAR1 family protein
LIKYTKYTKYTYSNLLAGQERHHAVSKSYLREAHCAILVYDISSLASFKRIKRWIDDVKESCMP